ncbi:hypothetical protein CWI38_0008p0170 [Hamiltosporidium tvaerminnensis]|uniref:Uncharacterized protein n=2 Tax=Hamiltosporidium TaxID=1176354 RepID=A0A4Q9L4Q8_9MICR|nr:hypothetical protein CWI39_1229p0010 [Hamiltosporidium magnivora]TBU20944.1 hypothetical protein CWI38_0008p0170 [Hamiltosporidium tvaerminnensis]
MPHTISDDDLSLSLLSSETDTPIKLADSDSLDVSYDICYDNIIKIHEYFDKDLEDQKELIKRLEEFNKKLDKILEERK